MAKALHARNADAVFYLYVYTMISMDKINYAMIGFKRFKSFCCQIVAVLATQALYEFMQG